MEYYYGTEGVYIENIQCDISSYLQDIKALFPPDYNPFYAGFGNRDTDELSYRKIGIPKGKIFIINPKVVLVHRFCGFSFRIRKLPRNPCVSFR